MNKNRMETTFRVTGMVGLGILLCLVLWAQRASRPSLREGIHDHSAPSQHGNDVTGKGLLPEQENALIPSGHMEDGTRVVEYDAFQYNFSPDPLVVRAGDKVRLLIKSRDVTHGVMIPEVDFSVEVRAGERKPAEFNAPAHPGDYPVFCSVFCGPDHGDMSARLVVLPAEKKDGHHYE